MGGELQGRDDRGSQRLAVLQRGDGSWYYTTTTVLAHGHIPQATLGFGYSLVLAPIVHFAGPNAMLGLPMIVVFNQLVLVPIALVCVYAIANMIGGRWFAFFVGAVWVVFPLAAIHYFLPDYHERYVDMQMPQMIGLSGEGDYPSMVLLLVSAYFVLRFVRFGRRLDVVTSGLAAGFAIAVKPSNLLFLPAPFLVLLVARNPRALALFAAVMLPSVIALTVWKYRGLGYLPAFQHSATVEALGLHPALVASPTSSWFDHFVPLDWHELRANFDAVGGYTRSGWLITAAIIGGFIGLARRWFAAAVLAAAWLGMYVVFKGSSTEVDVVRGDFFNHLIAAFPAFLFLVTSCVFLVGPLRRRKKRPDAVAAPERGRLRFVPAGDPRRDHRDRAGDRRDPSTHDDGGGGLHAMGELRRARERVRPHRDALRGLAGDARVACPTRYRRNPLLRGVPRSDRPALLHADPARCFALRIQRHDGRVLAGHRALLGRPFGREGAEVPTTSRFSSSPGQAQDSNDYLMLSRPASVRAVGQG